MADIWNVHDSLSKTNYILNIIVVLFFYIQIQTLVCLVINSIQTNPACPTECWDTLSSKVTFNHHQTMREVFFLK